MKIGYYQFYVRKNDKKFNINKVIDRLSLVDFDLIVIPELFTTGYLFASKNEIFQFAESFPNGETIRRLAELTDRKRGYIIGTIPEIEGKGAGS